MLRKTKQPVVLQKTKHIMVMISSWWLRLFTLYLLFQISTGLSRRSTFEIFILLNISSWLKVAESCLSYTLKAFCSACATLGVWFTWQGRSITLEWVVAQDRSYAWLKKMVSCLSFLCRTLICKFLFVYTISFFPVGSNACFINLWTVAFFPSRIKCLFCKLVKKKHEGNDICLLHGDHLCVVFSFLYTCHFRIIWHFIFPGHFIFPDHQTSSTLTANIYENYLYQWQGNSNI